MSGKDDLLKRIYGVFSPAPLPPDAKDLYVDLEAVRGNTGFVNTLAKHIRLAEEPTCQLLTGHLGSGKSTELRQLKRNLETLENPPFVVICEVTQDLSMIDADYPELLVVMLRDVAEQLETLGITLQPGYFDQRWAWIKKHLLAEVEFQNLTLKHGMVELAGILKHSPDTRKKFRELIDPVTDSWIEAANDVISKAESELAKQHFSGLVVLVDGLDHLSRARHPNADCSIGEYLYIHRKKELSGLRCHVVYTIPLYLAYSSLARTIASLYGISDIPVVPVTKIRESPPDSAPYEAGVARFREVICTRLKDVGAIEKDVFKPGTMDRLIALSAGQLRDLVIMIRDAAVTKLPIDSPAIDRVEGSLRRSYARWLEKKHWPIIEGSPTDRRYRQGRGQSCRRRATPRQPRDPPLSQR